MTGFTTVSIYRPTVYGRGTCDCPLASRERTTCIRVACADHHPATGQDVQGHARISAGLFMILAYLFINHFFTDRTAALSGTQDRKCPLRLLIT